MGATSERAEKQNRNVKATLIATAATGDTSLLLAGCLLFLACLSGAAGLFAAVQTAVLAAACAESGPDLHSSAQSATHLHRLTIAASSCATFTIISAYFDCVIVLLIAILCCFHAADKLSAGIRTLSALSAAHVAQRARTGPAALLLRNVSSTIPPIDILHKCSQLVPHPGLLSVHRTYAGSAEALTAARLQLAVVTQYRGNSETAEQGTPGIYSNRTAYAEGGSNPARGQFGIAAAASHLRLAENEVTDLDLQLPRCAPCASSPISILARADAVLKALAAPAPTATPAIRTYAPVVVVECENSSAARALARAWNADSTHSRRADTRSWQGDCSRVFVSAGSTAELVGSCAGVLWENFKVAHGDQSLGWLGGFEARFWSKSVAFVLLCLLIQGITSGANIFYPSSTDPRGVALGIGEGSQLPPLLTTFRVSMILATANSVLIRLIQTWCADCDAGFLQSIHRDRSAIARAVGVGTAHALVVWLYMFGQPGALFWVTYAPCSMITYPCIIALRVALNGSLFVLLRQHPRLAARRRAALRAMDGWAASANLGVTSGAYLLTAQLGIISAMVLLFSHAVPLLWLMLFALVGLSLACYPRIVRSSVPEALLPCVETAETGLWHCLPLGAALILCVRSVLVAMTWPSEWAAPVWLHCALAVVCAAAEGARHLQALQHRDHVGLTGQQNGMPALPDQEQEQGQGQRQQRPPSGAAVRPQAQPVTTASQLIHPLVVAYGCDYAWVQHSAGEKGSSARAFLGPWWGCFDSIAQHPPQKALGDTRRRDVRPGANSACAENAKA